MRPSLPWGIAIVGADGTGKSTLFTRLQNHYGSKLAYIGSVASNVIAKGYPLGKNASTASYVELNRQYVCKLNEVFSQACPYVSDRSLLDAYCYAQVNRRLPRPQIPDSFIEFLEAHWHHELNFVCLYLVCPAEFKPPDNGIRDTDEHYRQQIAEQFDDSLRAEYRARTSGTTRFEYKIVTGTPSEREQMAIRAIDDILP